jgi:hypothetical protein
VVPMCFGCFSHMFFDELYCFVWFMRLPCCLFVFSNKKKLKLKLLHVSVVRPSSGRNILAKITRLTTDPLFLEYSEHYSDRFDIWLLS